ncbi:MAG: N-methyl-L-tryptophan oxidase [Isosphaeraceae bacterium]|nr:N-methyl-L-tryptophan oxidase [Isosphaeraceae bacterium]
MQTWTARNVVLGAGAMGAAAAYHLARRGEPLLLVDQFPLGHDRGSSHGAARITRHSYADPRYARLMPEAFRAWRTLEADAGENLYLRTGGVSFCPPELDYVARVEASLKAIDVPHRRMSGQELRKSWAWFGGPDETDVVFEPDAGMLSAARAVAVQISLAQSAGGASTQILENSPVQRIDLDGERPTLILENGRIVAERLIVAAGAWTARLLTNLGFPLRATRQQVLYFRPTDVLNGLPGRFPVFISKGAEVLDDFYGMASFQGQGVKVARHGGPDVDPDSVDQQVGDEYRATVRRFLKKYLPPLAEAPIDRTEICLYTVAPDEQFRVGPLPNRSDVIVASPCSGHGFKFSCLIGQVLADWATHGATDLAVDFWQL